MTSQPRIVHTQPNGIAALVIPCLGQPGGPESLEEVIAQAVPEGEEYFICDHEDLPDERLLRDAWVCDCEAKTVTVDMKRAKQQVHEARRRARNTAMYPLDMAIAAKIPGATFEEVEEKRQELRDHYAAVQTAIEEATTPAELLQVCIDENFMLLECKFID